MYRCIVIDDEKYAVEALEKYISNLSQLELIASFTDAVCALNEVGSLGEIDLILLDIDMPKINGLELSKLLRPKTNKLIFTTSHSKYGYEAFKADADDYLLKPYTLTEFIMSIDKVFPQIGKIEKPVAPHSFFVKSKEENLKIINIRFDEVIAVESKMNYIMIHTSEKRITTYMTLSEMSVILEKYPGFKKFQRSFIIAERYIESISGNAINMANGLQVTVGDYYRKEFARFVSERLLRTGRR